MVSKNLENLNFRLPSDKSISHRLVLASLFCETEYQLINLTPSEDILASLEAVRALGVEVREKRFGEYSIKPSSSQVLLRQVSIDCMNSGTTARLLIGILAGKQYQSTVELIGDKSLSQRPMKRVTGILERIGCQFSSGDFLPIKINPSEPLRCINYELPIASAQVKSALLFAAIQIKGESLLTGKLDSRDHTERLFKHAGVDLLVEPNQIKIAGPQKLKLSNQYNIPRDPSAAAFWCLYAKLVNREVCFSGLLLNPSRLGFYQVLKSIGTEVHYNDSQQFYEPSGEMRVDFTDKSLLPIIITSSMIPSLIDEVPILSVLAALTAGKSVISGVSELKYKESDRLEACLILAGAFGAEAVIKKDDLIITGCKFEKTYDFGKLVESEDHRIIMILAMISKACDIPIELKYPELASISYPGFWDVLEQLS